MDQTQIRFLLCPIYSSCPILQLTPSWCLEQYTQIKSQAWSCSVCSRVYKSTYFAEETSSSLGVIAYFEFEKPIIVSYLSHETCAIRTFQMISMARFVNQIDGWSKSGFTVEELGWSNQALSKAWCASFVLPHLCNTLAKLLQAPTLLHKIDVVFTDVILFCVGSPVSCELVRSLFSTWVQAQGQSDTFPQPPHMHLVYKRRPHIWSSIWKVYTDQIQASE